MLAKGTPVTRIMAGLEGPCSSFGRTSTAFAQGSRAPGTLALEARFQYKPSLGATNHLRAGSHWLLLGAQGRETTRYTSSGMQLQSSRLVFLAFPGISLAVIPVSPGKRDMPAPASTACRGLLVIHEVPAPGS